MTYLGDEADHKRPIELYRFVIGATAVTVTDGEITVLHPVTDDEYVPEPITRGRLEQTAEDGSMAVEVTVDALSDVAQFFRAPFLPGRKIWLTIERTHEGSDDVGVVFRGEVNGAVFADGHAVLRCVPIREALARSIPTRLVQALCSNTLYDERCQADPADFSEVATITDIAATEVTLDDLDAADGYYNGGFVETAGKPAATVRLHEGNVLTLLYNPGYVVGDVLTVAAGCDKRFTTCSGKFVNTEHYQGFPSFPQRNPFRESLA